MNQNKIKFEVQNTKIRFIKSTIVTLQNNIFLQIIATLQNNKIALQKHSKN